MIHVKSSCPTRVDLAGGTLDLWPIYHQLKEKATVNLAVQLCAEVDLKEASSFCLESLDQGVCLKGSFTELTHSPELSLLSLFLSSLWSAKLPPIHVKTKARSPKGAGLGGSSSLSMALCSAFYRAREKLALESFPSEKHRVNFCRDLESVIIESPTGYQDYIAAVRGGLNIITYPFGFPEIKTLPLTQFQPLKDQILLVYSGQSRASALNNWSVYKSFFSGEKKTVSALQKIGQLASQCGSFLEELSFDKALGCSHEEWELRKDLWPDIVTERTEFIDRLATRHGASFTRVCGAGGGGVMAVFVKPAKKKNLSTLLKKEGVEVLEEEA